MSNQIRARSALSTKNMSSGDLSRNEFARDLSVKDSPVKDLPAKDLRVETVGPLPAKASQGKRCAHCGGPFGLVRRRRGGMQFCSAACMDGLSSDIRAFPGEVGTGSPPGNATNQKFKGVFHETVNASRRAVRDKIRRYAFLMHNKAD
jgi:hypothetical protein